MIVTLLGTGTSQGVPVIGCECEVCQSVDNKDNRLRSSIHVQTDQTSVVIDSGPDFRQQMLQEKIKRLDAILFTHQHKDHTAGTDDVRSFNFLLEKDIPLVATQPVIDQLKQEFAYAFAKVKYPGVPRIFERIIDNNPFEIQDIPFLPIEGLHYKLPVFGYRIKDFAYITDMNYIDDTEFEKLKGVKYLVLNALQKEKHISHFNLEEALEIVAKLKPEKTWFTHISHRLGRHKDIEAELPENVFLGYDGLKINIE